MTDQKSPGLSDSTERPEGSAFEVEYGTEPPGVPVGDQRPADVDAARLEENVRARGETPSGPGVPGTRDVG